MKRTLLISSLVTIAIPAIADDRPNILIMMADDMGYSDIGCYGGEISTPNLDRLASQGVRVTQFMNNAKSAPTRASLLTGLHAIEAGCSGAPNQMINCITIAELLQCEGYNTWMTGKWHAKEHPVKRGFEHYYGKCAGASNYYAIEKSRGDFMRDGEVINPITDENRDTFYTTDAYTTEAINFLDQYNEDGDPFLLYVAYNAPHYPLQAWEEDIAKYRGKYMIGWDELRRLRFAKQKELGIITNEAELSPRNPNVVAWEDFERKDDADLTMATYAAMVDRLDQNIGRLLQKLEDVGAAESTIVIFFSDNGANAEGQMWNGIDPKCRPDLRNSQAKQGDEWANASNTPFREYKRYMFNGGVCSPFIVRWAGSDLDGGTILHDPIHLVDLYPTLVELTGAQYPEGEKWSVEQEKGLRDSWDIAPLAGISVLDLIEKGISPQRETILGYFQGARMLRTDDWKLVSDGGDGTIQHLYDFDWELYNMKDDPSEIHNMAAQYPEMIDSLDLKYRNWITYAENLGNLGHHPWYVPRMTQEQSKVAEEMMMDDKLQQFLTRREEIGLQIVGEIDRLNLKIKRGLGMDLVPMSYFGLVGEGRKYAAEYPTLSELYEAWDNNINISEQYCQSKGEAYINVWKFQERVRPMIPQFDINNINNLDNE